MGKKYFIAGTDTGIGKTLVTSAFLHRGNELGLKTMGLKPVAAGCEKTDDGLKNEDAILLSEYASIKLAYQQINPIALQSPLSPHIAAEKEGKRLSVDRLIGYCRGSMMTPSDLCLIEGAGGWRVPINAVEYLSGFAKALNIPVILVVGMRLGCLNHAVLTMETISRDGLQVAGWVANHVDPNMDALDENIETLKHIFPMPCLGEIPYLEDNTPEKASEYLDISKLT